MSDLTTLDAVKAWLPSVNGGAYTSNSDAVLQRLITSCSQYVETWLNRHLLSASYADYYDGQNNRRVVTRQFPITAVASVSIDGVAIPQRAPLGSGSGFGYVFDDESVALAGYTFTRGVQNVAISYTAGYASVPADIEQAVIDMIGDWFKYRDRIGKLSESIEGQSITFVNADMPSRTRAMLQQYRKVTPT